MRSLLFTPADNEKKLLKGLASAADAVIVDLEDSVAASGKARAREIARDVLAAAPRTGRQRLIVRVNALDTGLIEADLDMVARVRPDAVMLPKCVGGVDVEQCGAMLAVREAEHNLPDGSIGIIALTTETARSLFHMGTFAGAGARLTGLTWGAEDLSADLGAETNRLADGAYAPPYAFARTLALLAAHAADVTAIDTIYADFQNEAGFRAECEAARRDGFTAKMAIHPAQVAIINAVFTPTPEAIARAQAIVDAFARAPGSGVIGIDGAMVDRPHLRRAERLLARAGRP